MIDAFGADPFNPNHHDPDHIENVIKAQFVSTERKAELLKNFQGAHHSGSPFYACAACGIRECVQDSHHAYTLVSVTTLPVVYQLTPEQLAAHARVPEEYRAAISTFTHPITKNTYHLHPELVFTSTKFEDGTDSAKEPQCHFCPKCNMARGTSNVSPLSIAAGVDFGLASRLKLSPLSPVEELLVSPARVYNTVIKLSATGGSGQSALKGHVCCFEQDAVEKAVNVVCPMYAKAVEHVHVQFLGPKEKFEPLLHKSLPAVRDNLPGPLTVRPKVIYEWLRAFKALNPRMRHIVIDESPEMVEVRNICIL